MSKKDLYRIVAEVLKIPHESADANLSAENTAEWDSMAQLGIILEIEAQFDVAFRSEEIIDLNSVGKLKVALETLGVALND